MKVELNKQVILEAYQMVKIDPNADQRGLEKFDSALNTTGTVLGAPLFGGIGALPFALYGRRTVPYTLGKSTVPLTIKENSNVIEEDGAWDKSMRARGQVYNNLDNQMGQNYDKNKVQYFLNPLVAGPIRHGIVKSAKATENGVYKLLKDNDSPDIGNQVTVAADAANGPLNSQLDVDRATSNNYTDDVRQIRKSNPAQYYLNPFVAGPLNSGMGHIAGAVSKGARVITSPTTKAGDTLVYNVGRRDVK